MDYALHILIVIGIYVMLSTSLNIIAGYSGLLSVAHAAFYGFGAYMAALLAVKLHTPFHINAACAIIMSGFLAIFIGSTSIRFRDDSFVLLSFAFQIIVYSILNNWIFVTGGPMGISNVPGPRIFWWVLSNKWDYLFIDLLLCAAVLWICRKIVVSPVGRVLKAIREDEVFSAGAGKPGFAVKLQAFVIGSCIAALAGVLYAYYVSFIDPSSFTILESIFIISIVILGGAGSLWGPVLGAVVLVTLPEILRFVGIPSAAASNIRQIFYGLALIACMIWRSQGLIGEYIFRGESRQE